MCIFSGAVAHVHKTRIFARLSGTGTQFLVYAMNYAANRDLAMILPLPVGSRDEKTTVRFIALDGYADLFDDLLNGFPQMAETELEGCYSLDVPAALVPLTVHRVGAFDASFVPSLADFGRLDKRFTLPAPVWEHLPQYADWGFAVFKLRPSSRRGFSEQAHPMAFEFVTRWPDTLFFPTVHVHDARHVPALEAFDHLLFYQGDNAEHPAGAMFRDGVPVSPEELKASATGVHPQFPKQRFSFGDRFAFSSPRPAAAFMNAQRTKGVVAGEQRCYLVGLEGALPNTDTLIPTHPANA